MTTMKPDFETAAMKAMETLVNHRVSFAPVDPLPILKTTPGVLVLSFAEFAESLGVNRADVVTLFGSANQDAVTTVRKMNGKLRYIVTYNQRLPFYMLQRALARELGHIILEHDGSRPEDVRIAEAVCFAQHFLCPRPVIRAIQEAGIPVTVEVVGNISGCYERCLAGMRKTPATHVPPALNRAVRSQFADYIENYVAFQSILKSEDESMLANFGTFMDGYQE